MKKAIMILAIAIATIISLRAVSADDGEWSLGWSSGSSSDRPADN